jgi:hypothetical protein
MPNNTLNKTSNAVFVDVMLSKQTIRQANAKVALEKTVWRYDQEAKGVGSIRVPLLSNAVANNKVANVPVGFQSTTETEVIVTLDQHKEASYAIEDILQLQTNHDLRRLYAEAASTAIAKARDASIAALATGLSQTKGTYNNAITADVILDSVLLLDNADVPEEDRWFAHHPGVKRDILDLAVYTSSDYVSGKPTETGKYGNIYGLQTIVSTQVLKSGTSTSNMIYHKEAFIMAVSQDIRVQYGYILQLLANALVADTVYGVIEARDTFGVLVKT